MIRDNKVAISVVCYNNEDEIISFAHEIAMQSISNNIKLIVTCNSTKKFDFLKLSLEQVSIKVYIHNPKKNLGYLSGCLYGVEHTAFLEHYWIMISNTDLQFPSKYFFENILKNINTDVWCIGPNITLKETGRAQNPFFVRRPSRYSILFRKIIYSNYLLYRAYFWLSEVKSRNIKNQRTYSNKFVYAIHGSCFLLNGDAASVLIKECKNIFMYGEELLVAEIIREQGKRIYYNSTLLVIHNENQVTKAIDPRKKQQWFKRSTNFLYNRFWRF